LGTMLATLSAHKAGWDARWDYCSDWAERGHLLQDKLIALVDEDTEAFNRIMAVFAMPKKTPEEKAARAAALEEATLYATEVPLRTMATAFETFDLLNEMAEKGNPASVSDAGVGALAARAAVLGAQLNVRINAAGLKDRAKAASLLLEAEKIAEAAREREEKIIAVVNNVIDKE
ncbi:MAG: cyclodeaminase/cyclohydrolase family protein, partial [Muribaculaceae bacterium]|nr:cyclodeaminase/cyclohydrolase family protein [Muribaculaceae bacterium]